MVLVLAISIDLVLVTFLDPVPVYLLDLVNVTSLVGYSLVLVLAISIDLVLVTFLDPVLVDLLDLVNVSSCGLIFLGS